MKSITDKKTFWKTVKPLFSDKQVQLGKITLVKGDEITADNKEVANIFNNFFANIIKNMNIKMNDDHLSDTENLTDRSSRPEVFCKKAVLKNFAMFTGKRLCWSLFLMLQAFGLATLLKRDSNTGVFL